MESAIHETLKTLEKLSPKALEAIGKEHLESSNYEILGYWDDSDNFYEKVNFQQPLFLQFSSYSLNKTLTNNQNPQHWINLKFLLKHDSSRSYSEELENTDNIIGELTLILDSDFQFVDENWKVDINSPWLIATPADEA